MHYRTVGDLSELVNTYAHRVPRDIDLIVGIPRSGMLVASILSLKLNIPMTDLYSFKRNDALEHNVLRSCHGNQLARPWEANRVLLVDDSIASGNSMREAVEMAREVYDGDVLTMVAFAMRDNTSSVDIFLETVEQPRLFEWNIMHHNLLSYSCMNLDGILCKTPPPFPGMSDCEAYFADCKPLFIPSAKVGQLLTSMPESCRATAEAWLEQHGIRYDVLHMFAEPERQDGHPRPTDDPMLAFSVGVFKRDPHALLMFESDPDRARQIMEQTQKPVFCVPTNRMYTPGFSWNALIAPALRKMLTLRAKAVSRIREWIGPRHA